MAKSPRSCVKTLHKFFVNWVCLLVCVRGKKAVDIKVGHMGGKQRGSQGLLAKKWGVLDPEPWVTECSEYSAELCEEVLSYDTLYKQSDQSAGILLSAHPAHDWNF